MPAYVPEDGDLIWLTFDPQAGHEPAGRRPALVLSPRTYNHKSGLAVVCPATNQMKGYPFEVPVPRDCGVTGVFLADQVKSLDWKQRQAVKIGRVPLPTLNEVLARLAPLLGYLSPNSGGMPSKSPALSSAWRSAFRVGSSSDNPSPPSPSAATPFW